MRIIIFQLFIEGHTSLNRVKKFTEKYGQNICKFDYKLINLYFWKAEVFLLIWGAVIFGPEETIWDGGCFKLILEFNEEYPVNLQM